MHVIKRSLESSNINVKPGEMCLDAPYLNINDHELDFYSFYSG